MTERVDQDLALSPIVATVVGTQTYPYQFPGVTSPGASPFSVQYVNPLPATAVNTAVTITVSAGGVGGTCACHIYGNVF